MSPDNTVDATSNAPGFAADEPQPASAINEHNALSEREDGVNRGETPAAGHDFVAPPITLAADEVQPVSAIAERNAMSEREDGTNRGG